MTAVTDLRSWPWLQQLIGIDTTSRDTNLPLIELVAAAIGQHGVEPVIIYNDERTKANLLATFPAADGTTEGGIVLSGHTDVVPVDGQDWATDPFTATPIDDKIYGRGTCDMKGYLAAAMASLPDIAAAQRTKPIHFAFSYDEEVGCTGAQSLVKAFATESLWPAYCVVGEPTNMRVIAAHKSISLFEVTFHGLAAHSSRTPFGLNTIKYAARFATWFHDLMDDLRVNGPHDPAFEIPFTTGGVNMFDGGIAGNTVPDTSTLTFEFRTIGAQDPQEILTKVREQLFDVLEPAMRAEQPEGRIELTIVAETPGLDTSSDSPVLNLGSSLGGIAAAEKVNYGTEAGMFQSAGMETIVCGPGDIAQAHAANEFVTIAQMKACEDFMQRVVAWASA